MYGALRMHVFTHVFLLFNSLMGMLSGYVYTVLLINLRSSFLILKKVVVMAHQFQPIENTHPFPGNMAHSLDLIFWIG
jgi:hypothetical protein